MLQYRILLILLLCVPNIACAKSGIYIPLKAGWSYYENTFGNQDMTYFNKGFSNSLYQDYIPQDDHLKLPNLFIKSLLQAKGASIGGGYHFSDDLSLEGNYLGYRKSVAYSESYTPLKNTVLSQLPAETDTCIKTSTKDSPLQQSYDWGANPWQSERVDVPSHTTIRINTPTTTMNSNEMWNNREETITRELSEAQPIADKKITYHGLTYTHGLSFTLKITVLDVNRYLNIYGIGSLSYLKRVLQITTQEANRAALSESSDTAATALLWHLGMGIRYSLYPNCILDAAWISTVKRHELSNHYNAVDTDDRLDLDHIHLIKIGININL